jgi:hypothetical protein
MLPLTGKGKLRASGFRSDLRRDVGWDTTTAVKWAGAELRLKLVVSCLEFVISGRATSPTRRSCCCPAVLLSCAVMAPWSAPALTVSRVYLFHVLIVQMSTALYTLSPPWKAWVMTPCSVTAHCRATTTRTHCTFGTACTGERGRHSASLASWAHWAQLTLLLSNEDLSKHSSTPSLLKRADLLQLGCVQSSFLVSCNGLGFSSTSAPKTDRQAQAKARAIRRVQTSNFACCHSGDSKTPSLGGTTTLLTQKSTSLPLMHGLQPRRRSHSSVPLMPDSMHTVTCLKCILYSSQFWYRQTPILISEHLPLHTSVRKRHQLLRASEGSRSSQFWQEVKRSISAPYPNTVSARNNFPHAKEFNSACSKISLQAFPALERSQQYIVSP